MLRSVRVNAQAVRTGGVVAAGILTGAFALAARIMRRDANPSAAHVVCNMGSLSRAQLLTRNATNDKFSGFTTTTREFNTRLIIGRMYQLSMRRDENGLLTGWVDGVQEPTTYSGDAGSIANGVISIGAGSMAGAGAMDGLVCDYAMWTASAGGVPTNAELMTIGRNAVPIRDLLGMRAISTVPVFAYTLNRLASDAVIGTEPDLMNWGSKGTDHVTTMVNGPSWSVESPFGGGASAGAKAAAGRRG